MSKPQQFCTIWSKMTQEYLYKISWVSFQNTTKWPLAEKENQCENSFFSVATVRVILKTSIKKNSWKISVKKTHEKILNGSQEIEGHTYTKTIGPKIPQNDPQERSKWCE